MSWLDAADVPTPEEIGHLVNGVVIDVRSVNKELEPNRARGAWVEGRDFYLQTQYELFREDAITPLRESVNEIRAHPHLLERQSILNTRIYESGFITGLTLCRKSLAIRFEFSTARSEKRIRWAQSKRLKTGTIVALSPKNDLFRTTCKVAVVVSRVCSQLQVEPPAKPTIHLEWGDPRELEFDPQQEWLMVEASSGYWEANRHTLRALQQLHNEKFPFVEHLVDVVPNVGCPDYRIHRPIVDLGPAMVSQDCHEILEITKDWPDFTKPNKDGKPPSHLDASQLDALRRILTKSLAVVQGPPGTGKTYISVVALHVMLQNMTMDDPPIIVSAHTNHALDQLLRHVSKFEPRFVRIGGQTLDKEIVGPRTLQKIRDEVSVDTSATTRRAVFKERGFLKELQNLLFPLTTHEPFTPAVFKSLGLITAKQQQTLENIERDYVGDDFNDSDDPINIYCGNQLLRFEKTSDNSYFDKLYEEYDETMQTEDDDELEFQNDKFELLHGTTIKFENGFSVIQHPEYSDDRAKGLLAKTQDMSRIPSEYRGSVYAYLQKVAKIKIRDNIREIAAQCKQMSREFQIGRWEQDKKILRDQNTRIIGMTTTGLSKYRALVSSLKPKVLLIEEAAETLEMYITAACVPSLEHLILVGDHQQLRGHCNVQEFENAPWNLDVSLFERLVNNGIEFTQLKQQRRMRPHIREIVNPIYPELTDHPSVEDRADIPGMGGLNSCFFQHSFPESNDDALSKQNIREAEFIVQFYRYLYHNGLAPSEITVLTFYNGQRKLIARLMSKTDSLRGLAHKVVTVDSYQGEENEVILLSLTRNNERGQIGFLEVDNRVCVALSRARRGLYLFGDSVAVYQKSPLWEKVLDVIGEGHESISESLPLVCQKHNTTTWVSEPTELEGLDGGCRLYCEESRPCGHQCRLHCHPRPHEELPCEQRCLKILHCQHQCSYPCWYPEHECTVCEEKPSSEVPPTPSVRSKRTPSPRKQRQPQITGRITPQCSYHPGFNSMPPTPNAHNDYRAYAAGGCAAEDKRIRDQAQKDYEERLAQAAQEKFLQEQALVDLAISPPPARQKWTEVWTSNAVNREVKKLTQKTEEVSLLD